MSQLQLLCSSVDGVSECKSNVNNLDVYSTRFAHCRTIYPLQIIRTIGKHRVDNKHYLDQFLTDVCSNNCHIDVFVGDKPKRSDAKDCKGILPTFHVSIARVRAIYLKHRKIMFRRRKVN